MFQVAMSRSFSADHVLRTQERRKHDDVHKHPYRVRVLFSGRTLDRNGYLLDMAKLEEAMDAMVAKYSGETLNEMPEFSGLNPSMENFCLVWARGLMEIMEISHVDTMSVRIWEREDQWASYTEQL